jgi:hypothetical protein
LAVSSVTAPQRKDLPLFEEFLGDQDAHRAALFLAGFFAFGLVVVLVVVIGTRQRGGETGLKMVEMHRYPTLGALRTLASPGAGLPVRGERKRVFSLDGVVRCPT